MGKEDKQFFIGLFKGLEGRFDGLEGRFDGLEGHFRVLNEQVGKNYEAIQKNSDGIKSLDTRVRLNGLEIDKINHKIDLIGEGQSIWETIKTDVEDIKENISDLPAIRKAISSHSLELAGLRR